MRLLAAALGFAVSLCAANSYVDPRLCAACHPQEAKAFAKTGMARSFYKPTAEATAPGIFHHQQSDTWYAIERRGDTAFQRRWRIGPDGKPIDLQELSIDYVLGSGFRSRTYLHRTERGALIELPLAWYAENGGGYAMSPGYDRAYSLPHRAVAYECMFCHNAYPRLPPGHDEPGAEALYTGGLPEGIDCQRCHGPGGDHVSAAQAAGSTPAAIRAKIVNPARLTPARQMEICMQCHLETTSQPLPHSIVRYNRGPFSYIPGERLTDFELFFDRAPAARSPNDFEIVSSAYRLRQSQCFLKSAGKLTCLTCHSPHGAQRDYNETCAACHAATARHAESSDCTGCHMPKRRTQDVVHAVMTDHLIRRRPVSGDPLAPLSEQTQARRSDVVPYYAPSPATSEDSLYAAVAQGLPRLTSEIASRKPAQAQFYVELGQAEMAAGGRAKAVAAFEQAVQRKPDSSIVALNLADALTQSGQPQQAAAVLERALQKRPDEPQLWYQLGIAMQDQPATTAFEKAIALDPDFTEAHNLLGAALAAGGDLARGEAELRLAIEIDPDYPDALGNLGHLLAVKHDLPAAAFYLARAVAIKPNDAEIHTNYAVVLAGLNRAADALVQINAAVKADPKSAEAHNFRGVLLEQSGDRGALAEFLEAARLDPGFARAHWNAARLLLAAGNRAEALIHLRAAAEGSDPGVARQAADALRQLGR
jgi:Flp pilus assembly protein TadD